MLNKCLLHYRLNVGDEDVEVDRDVTEKILCFISNAFRDGCLVRVGEGKHSCLPTSSILNYLKCLCFAESLIFVLGLKDSLTKETTCHEQ